MPIKPIKVMVIDAIKFKWFVEDVTEGAKTPKKKQITPSIL